eukprot:evm.model.scf_1194EXC.5 EVM.evm.TU.scf_1194EXC.5   scf_1194EXC:28017-39546(-)
MGSASWADHGLLAACAGCTVRVWDGLGNDGGAKECTVTDDRTLLSASWNHNNKVLAFAGESGRIFLYSNNSMIGSLPPRDGATEAETRPVAPVQSLMFATDFKYIISGGKDGNVILWHLRRQTPNVVITDHRQPVTALAVSSSMGYLASASAAGEVFVYSLPQIKKFGKYYSNTSDPKRCLAFSRDASDTVVVAGDDCGRVFVWDAVGRMVRAVERWHEKRVSGIEFSMASNSVLYTAGMDKRFVAWDSRGGKKIIHEMSAPITCMSCKGDGAYIAFGTTGGEVLVHDIRRLNKPLARSLVHPTEKENVMDVKWQRNLKDAQPLAGAPDPVLSPAAGAPTTRPPLGRPKQQVGDGQMPPPPPPQPQQDSQAWPFSPVRDGISPEDVDTPDATPAVDFQTPSAMTAAPAAPRSAAQNLMKLPLRPPPKPPGFPRQGRGSLAAAPSRPPGLNGDKPVQTPTRELFASAAEPDDAAVASKADDDAMSGVEEDVEVDAEAAVGNGHPPSGPSLAAWEQPGDDPTAAASLLPSIAAADDNNAELQLGSTGLGQDLPAGVMAAMATADGRDSPRGHQRPGELDGPVSLDTDPREDRSGTDPDSHDLSRLVDAAVKRHIVGLREDLRSMHLDNIRQFHYQQVETMRIAEGLAKRQDELSAQIESLKQMIMQQDSLGWL